MKTLNDLTMEEQLLLGTAIIEIIQAVDEDDIKITLGLDDVDQCKNKLIAAAFKIYMCGHEAGFKEGYGTDDSLID